MPEECIVICQTNYAKLVRENKLAKVNCGLGKTFKSWQNLGILKYIQVWIYITFKFVNKNIFVCMTFKKACKYLNPNNITFSKYIVLGTGLADHVSSFFG